MTRERGSTLARRMQGALVCGLCALLLLIIIIIREP